MAKYGEHSSAWELGQTGGGRAAPGLDCWQLVRGRGARGQLQGQSERKVGPPSLPLAQGLMQDSLSRNSSVGRATNTGAHR